MKAVVDTNILIDYLNGSDKAQRELDVFDAVHISLISWMEVLVGAKEGAEESEIREFLRRFQVHPVDEGIAERAVEIRRADTLEHAPEPSGGAVDSHGTVYFAWDGVNASGQAKGPTNLYVTKSTTGGATWTTSLVDVSQAAPQCGCGGWDFWGGQMALGLDTSDHVYVLWNANRVKYGPQRLFFKSSADGVNWSAAADVSGAPVGANNAFPALVATGNGDVRIAWMDDRNGFDAGSNDPNARWNTYYRSSTDRGATWSDESKLSAFVTGYTYKLATPKDGYLQPYGDYFEMDIDSNGKTVAIWGEGNSYVGPGNVWFARQQ